MTIEVRGGPLGTSVVLDALERTGAALRREGATVLEVVERLTAAVVASDLAASHAVSPRTALEADRALLEAVGPTGLARDVVVLQALGSAAQGAAEAYRAADAGIAASLETAQDLVMGAVGRQLPQLVVGVLTLDALGVDVARVLDEAAYHVPALAELGGGVDGLASGIAGNPLTAPLLLPGAVARVGGEEADLAGGALADDDVAVRVLADSAAVWGLLRDRGRSRVTAEPRPRAGAAPPTDLASLARDQRNLSDGARYPGHVRVVEVPHDDGAAWVVEIAGTQVWDPRPAESPFDVTTDVRLMAQESTVLAQGVAEALDRAQAASGRNTSAEPVLLAGHSLGGMVAAGLASSSRFREAHGPVSVVTMASPVSRMPVPMSVSVLSVEHLQDAVPRLDGTANPDRAGWLTVTRDLRGDSDHIDTASGAHDTSEYVETAAAIDRSDDPSLQDWREQHRQFFEPDGDRTPVVRDYRVERVAR